MSTLTILSEVLHERMKQEDKWGEQNHPDGTSFTDYSFNRDTARRECDEAAKAGTVTWRLVLQEEVLEAFAEEDQSKLRAELIQVAAVATAWAEKIDRSKK